VRDKRFGVPSPRLRLLVAFGLHWRLVRSGMKEGCSGEKVLRRER
jgi:hypothetical protein